jgi:hypothetical protein
MSKTIGQSLYSLTLFSFLRWMMRLVGDFALAAKFIRRGVPLWAPWLYVAATPPMEWAGTGACPFYGFPRLSRGGGQGVVWVLILPAVLNHPPAPSLDKEGEHTAVRSYGG